LRRSPCCCLGCSACLGRHTRPLPWRREQTSRMHGPMALSARRCGRPRPQRIPAPLRAPSRRDVRGRDVRARNVRARVNACPHPHVRRRASIACADVTRCCTRPARGAGARAPAPLRALTLSARSADGADVRGSALSAPARVRGASTTSAADMGFGTAVLPGANPQKSVFNKLTGYLY
jgi:hypothetical protein